MSLRRARPVCPEAVGHRARRGGARAAIAITAIVVLVPVLTAASGAASPRGGAGTTRPAGASTAAPTVEGPVTGGNGIFFVGSTTFDLATVGYQESEFFISGTATGYTSSQPLSSNGRWTVKAAATAPYKTRVVVYRPIDPKRFNGIVAVEWLNVTAGIDSSAVWLSGHDELIREGAAFVGVSVQQAGVQGQTNSLASASGIGGGGLKASDPVRYGTLQHPGDTYSYSIFTQAGAAVHHSGTELLSGLKPRTVLAVGESQSARYLTTYLDAVAPSTNVWDGYLVYSRGGAGAMLAQAPLTPVPAPTPTLIRTDLRQPVLIFTTEADLMALGYLAARQPDTSKVRDWEVAGTAHDDTYGLTITRTDNGTEQADIAAFESMRTPTASPIPGIVDCAAPINAGAHTYELRAAIVALERWVRTGVAPPTSPRLRANPAQPGTFVLDANGEALGGIRTPQVSAPVAKLSGVGQPPQPPAPGKPQIAANLCIAFGTTVPLTSSQLAALYSTHQAFVTAWDTSVDREVRAGFLLPADATRLKAVAAQSSVPR
jgi:hypothetical protein